MGLGWHPLAGGSDSGFSASSGCSLCPRALPLLRREKDGSLQGGSARIDALRRWSASTNGSPQGVQEEWSGLREPSDNRHGQRAVRIAAGCELLFGNSDQGRELFDRGGQDVACNRVIVACRVDHHRSESGNPATDVAVILVHGAHQLPRLDHTEGRQDLLAQLRRGAPSVFCACHGAQRLPPLVVAAARIVQGPPPAPDQHRLARGTASEARGASSSDQDDSRFILEGAGQRDTEVVIDTDLRPGRMRYQPRDRPR